jgi:hypothetical protein
VLLLAAPLSAQWTVPYRIALNGPDTADRQVLGLDAPLEPSAGVSLEAARTQATHRGQASGTNALTVDLVPAPAGYTPGLRVVLVPANVNTTAVTLDVNGLGPVAVRKHVDVPLDSADLRPGIPVILVHDGTLFQVTSQLPRSCPKGSLPFTADACIDTSAQTSSWFQANVTCANRNGRLCTMLEWTAACLTRPAMLGSVTAFEWVDSAANNAGDAKMIGYDSVGQTPNCSLGAWASPQDNRPYRCCYDR